MDGWQQSMIPYLQSSVTVSGGLVMQGYVTLIYAAYILQSLLAAWILHHFLPKNCCRQVLWSRQLR